MNRDDKNEKKRFSGIIKGLAISAGKEINDGDVLRLYYGALEEFSIEQINDAAVTVLKYWEHPRIPPPSVIIKAIRGSGLKSVESKAQIIASEIISHVMSKGAGVFPDLFNDKIAQYLMTRRWPYIRWASSIVESEHQWWIKQFVEAYVAYAEVGEDRLQNLLENQSHEMKRITGNMLKLIEP